MKKCFAFTALAGLLFAACAKEEIAPVETAAPETGTYEFTLTASMDTELTKTAYASDQYFSWSAGDQISVLFHKGDDNKFFTLTTYGSGTSASFSGTIETGYEIGASDDASKKIALFPAGAHTYTAGVNPVFNIPARTDFTKTHFSANLPMAAIGNSSNQFSFYHLSGAYKVVFGSIDPSVTKVVLYVKNKNTKKLSGNYTLQDNITCWWDEGADEGSDDQKVSYVVNVEGGKATFYIPYGHNQDHFLPEFTLKNAVNGNTLKTVTAKSKVAFLGSENERIPLKTRLVVLPEIPAPGTGTAPEWKSKHGINWDMVEAQVAGRSSSTYGGIRWMRATSDASYLYILLDINASSSYLLDNDTYDYSNYAVLYAGNGTASGSSHWGWSPNYQDTSEGWLKTGNAISYTKGTGGFLDAIASLSGDGKHCYYEITYPRTTALQGTTAYIGFTFDKRYRIGSTVYNDGTLGSTAVGYAPTTNSDTKPPMMQITLPTYAAPAASTASPINISFTESSGEVSNPERGFYRQQSFHFRDGNIPSASLWSNPENLVLPLFYFEDFRESYSLSDAVLERIEDIFDNIRAAGKKAIVRFGYINAHGNSDKPWDAGITNIRHHIAQVKPILQANEDIIYVMQAGFVGVFGEWYYVSDDFNYSISGTSVVDYDNRAQVITDLLAAVPNRQVSLRTAKYKRYFLNPTAIGTWTPISSWGTSDNQRLGFFNDGFRGGPVNEDIGTFEVQTDYDMWYSQSAWVITGGEAAYRGGDTAESKNAWLTANPDLASLDNAIAQVRAQHFSYINANEENILMDYWDGATQGEVGTGESRIPELRKALGYRLVLGDVHFDFTSLTAGSTLNYSIEVRNTGSAPVYYQRPFQLVLVHASGDPTVLVDNLMDVRNLAAGADATTLSGSFNLPAAVAKGDKLAIWLPDGSASLRSNASYSIHLANDAVTWSNGYNVLFTFE